MAGRDGRLFRREIIVQARATPAGIELLAPMPGLLRDVPATGEPIAAGGRIGALDVLGVLHELRAPADVSGVVVGDGPRLGERSVAYGEALVRLVPQEHSAQPSATTRASEATASADRLLYRAPLSGRYYARPSPDKPAFVQPGSEVGPGQTVALLEVMKTFNRLTYGGAGLPERARVKALLVRDEDDVDAGTPILELEPL